MAAGGNPRLVQFRDAFTLVTESGARVAATDTGEHIAITVSSLRTTVVYLRGEDREVFIRAIAKLFNLEPVKS